MGCNQALAGTEPSNNGEAAKLLQAHVSPVAGKMLQERSDALGFGLFDLLCAGCFRGLVGMVACMGEPLVDADRP